MIRQQILEHLIVQEAEMQRADHAGLKISDETLNNADDRNRTAQRHVAAAAAAGTGRPGGSIYASYRDSMRRELTLRLLQQRDVVNRIAITPREIDQYLDRQARHPSANAEYNVSHILIAVAAGSDHGPAGSRAEKKADDIFRRAKGGEDFAKLALANS